MSTEQRKVMGKVYVTFHYTVPFRKEEYFVISDLVNLEEALQKVQNKSFLTVFVEVITKEGIKQSSAVIFNVKNKWASRELEVNTSNLTYIVYRLLDKALSSKLQVPSLN